MTGTLRSHRGYNFEYKIVESLNSNGWQCKRMGGSSVNNPDEIATYNELGILLIIEAKSTVGPYCYMPVEQIERFEDIKSMFGYYRKKYFIFAFKFGDKGKRGKTKYFYHVFKHFPKQELDIITSVRCDKQGMLTPILKPDWKKTTNIDYFTFYNYYFMCDSIDRLKEDLLHPLLN